MVQIITVYHPRSWDPTWSIPAKKRINLPQLGTSWLETNKQIDFLVNVCRHSIITDQKTNHKHWRIDSKTRHKHGTSGLSRGTDYPLHELVVPPTLTPLRWPPVWKVYGMQGILGMCYWSLSFRCWWRCWRFDARLWKPRFDAWFYKLFYKNSYISVVVFHCVAWLSLFFTT